MECGCAGISSLGRTLVLSCAFRAGMILAAVAAGVSEAAVGHATFAVVEIAANNLAVGGSGEEARGSTGRS